MGQLRSPGGPFALLTATKQVDAKAEQYPLVIEIGRRANSLTDVRHDVSGLLFLPLGV